MNGEPLRETEVIRRGGLVQGSSYRPSRVSKAGSHDHAHIYIYIYALVQGFKKYDLDL